VFTVFPKETRLDSTVSVRVIDLARPAREQTFSGEVDERNLTVVTAQLAGSAVAFLGRKPTPVERAAMRRPTMLSKDALVAVGKGTVATTAAEREAFFKLAVKHAPRSGLAWYLHARTLHASGRTVEAISAYRRSIQLDPDDVACHYDLGNAFFDGKRYVEAAAEYQKAIALDATHAPSHENLIRAWRAQGVKPLAMIQGYSESMEILFEKTAAAQLQTGRLYWEMGKHPEAIAAFRKAVALDATDPILQFNLAHALERSGKIDEAIPYYQQAVKYAPDYVLAWNNLGILYGKRGKHRLEAEAFRKQTKLTPTDAVAWFNLGIAYHRMKEYRAASAAYKKSLALSPNDKPTHWHLALAYERTATWNLANQHWRKVLLLNPTDDERQTAEKHMRENEKR